jgi:hypothetical protein
MAPQIMPLPILLALLIPWLLALAPGVGSGAADQTRGLVWRSECVDCPTSVFQIGDRSLVVDAAGLPHVVYAGDMLYYASYDGAASQAAWQVETIDSAPGSDDLYPSPASLALDAAGAPHVSYLSAAGTALKYARRTPQGWQVQTVDSLPAGQVFNYDTALALDSAGRPRIAYLKNGQLWYAAWTGSAWRSQLVDATQKAEFHVSLAVDAADQPHISYGVWRGAAGLYLKYAQRAGGAWTSEVVEDGFLGEYNAIALDSHGAPHISYLDYARSQLKVAHRTPAGWQIEVIDGVQWFGGFTSIAVDSQDLLHVTYAGPPVGVRYARGAGGAWQLETVGSAGWYTSLALDPAGQPRMAYFDTTGRSLAYGRRDATGWSLHAVDRLADAGSFNSLAVSTAALGAAGEPVVAYYEAGHGDLRVARQSGSQWQVETVDGAAAAGGGVGPADVGMYASLACNPAGPCWISYYDATNGDLKAARQDPAGWVSETVDSGGIDGIADVGRYTALALAAGGVWISYYDATHGDLKLARRDAAGGWQLATVDSAAGAGGGGVDSDVGRYTAIALDGDGAWISYYDATGGDLKAAHWQDGKWLIETVDSAGDVGAYTSLALDAGGAPHISYYDATHGDLKVAHRSDGRWLTETVDADGVGAADSVGAAGGVGAAGSVGVHSSLALAADGEPRISYTSAGSDELRYAWRTGGLWSTQVVRQGWQTAAATSLVLDEHGNLLISFYDPGWRSLRLLRGAPFGVYLPLVLVNP